MSAKDFEGAYYIGPFGEPGAAPVAVSENQVDIDTLKKRNPRKPSIRSLIKQAEKAGKPVTSVTTPEGVTLNFGKPDDVNQTNNPWDEVLPHERH